MNRKRTFCLALLALLFSLVGTSAQDFRARVYKSERGEELLYRLFVPRNYSPKKKYPLVVWLHGSGGRGSDNLKQISAGNAIGSQVWAKPENQSKHPCFVVAPQCPADETWATSDHIKPTRRLELVVELIERLKNEYSIDGDRLYVAGQSMGGFGAWAVMTEHPKMFAAAVPIAGGGDEARAAVIKDIPIWAFHGEKDEAVTVDRSRNMIEAVKRAGGSPRYTEFKGADHLIWSKVFSQPELLPWVFSQKRHSKN
jgi:predicted peptidase